MKRFVILVAFAFCSLISVDEQSQSSGKKSYMLAFLSPLENNYLSPEEIQVIENEHLRNISRLSENGFLANAGPFEGGGELLLLNTSNRNETESLLENDPAIVNHLLHEEILQIEVRHGGICAPLIPYEMKTYSFIRFSPTNQIANYKTNSDFEMKRLHDNYIQGLIRNGGGIIFEGVFAGNDGSIMIHKNQTLDSRINEDPAIRQGYLKAEVSTIWLNKGSFCDN